MFLSLLERQRKEEKIERKVRNESSNEKSEVWKRAKAFSYPFRPRGKFILHPPTITDSRKIIFHCQSYLCSSIDKT